MAHKKARTTGTGGGKSRYMTRAEAKDGARVRRRREDGVSVKQAGYRFCACRDCFETVIADVEGVFCDACGDAGCSPDAECCAPGSYDTYGEE